MKSSLQFRAGEGFRQSFQWSVVGLGDRRSEVQILSARPLRIPASVGILAVFGMGCAIDVIKDSVCQTNRVRRISLEERVIAPPQPVINDVPRKPSAHPLVTSAEAEWSSASGSSLRFPVRQSDVRRSHDPGSNLCDMTSAGQQSVVSVSPCADLGLAMGSEAVRRTWTQQTFSDEFRSTRRGGRLTHRVGLCPHNDVYGLR